MNTILFPVMAVCLMAIASTEARDQNHQGTVLCINGACNYDSQDELKKDQNQRVITYHDNVVCINGVCNYDSQDGLNIFGGSCPNLMRSCRRDESEHGRLSTNCEAIKRACSKSSTVLESHLTIENDNSNTKETKREENSMAEELENGSPTGHNIATTLHVQ